MKLFEEICSIYFEEELLFFQSFLDTETRIKLDSSEYFRIPVYQGEAMVLLMAWGRGAGTAIHDHGGVKGKVKILHGSIEEVRYSFKTRELTETCRRLHGPGEIIDVSNADIHAITNKEQGYSLSLHVYDMTSESLSGVRIFDPRQRRVGVLNDKARRASWKENPSSFSSIVCF